MIIREVFTDALLGLAAAIVLVSSAGALVMRGAYDKLHFVTPAALVAPVLVTLAVLVHAGFSAATAETLLALLFMVIAGPFLTHATIRAARVRERGDWRPPAGLAASTPVSDTGEHERPGGSNPLYGPAGPDGCLAGDDPGSGGGRRDRRGARPRPGPAGHR